MLSFLFPAGGSDESAGRPAKDGKRPRKKRTFLPTLDRVGLCELRQVGDQRLGDVLPGLALAQPQVDVGARELVYVEPDVLVPAKLYEVLVCLVSASPPPSAQKWQSGPAGERTLKLVLADVDKRGRVHHRGRKVVHHSRQVDSRCDVLLWIAVLSLSSFLRELCQNTILGWGDASKRGVKQLFTCIHARRRAASLCGLGKLEIFSSTLSTYDSSLTTTTTAIDDPTGLKCCILPSSL